MKNIDKYIKIIKQEKNVEVDYQEKGNRFFLKAKGIINNMETKKQRITNAEILQEMREGFNRVWKEFDKVNTRLDRIEQCPTIKRELNGLK